MDSTATDEHPPDPMAELRVLVGQLRGHLRRHVAVGAWAAPGGPTAAWQPTFDVAALAEASEPAAPDDIAESDVGVPLAITDATTMRGMLDAAPPSGERARGEAIPAQLDDARRGGDAAPTFDEPIQIGRRTLAQIREELGDCKRCKLCSTRNKIVFGVGADAPVMFIGEAPGEQEDRRGEPFVGPAGELLDRMIEAMGWTRRHVYIANILKCRPPGNRNPQPDEVARCTPFLDAQIQAIAPRIIVTLGRPAANHVLGRDVPISALRGRFHDRQGVKVMPTFHPAYLLRDPDKKRETWSDLKQVIAELERLGIKSPNPPRG
jgi:uracil-DNA glycosylase